MDWSDLTRRQGGVISRGQLRALGCTDDAIQSMLRHGRLERTDVASVHRARGAPVVPETDAWRAVLGTGSPLSYLSAARWWGMPVPDDPWVHITRLDRRRLDWPSGVRVHRVGLDHADVTELRGLAVTTRVETVLDCLGWLTLGRARTLGDRAIQRGWLRLDHVARRLETQPGRWGNRQLRRLLRELGDGAAAHSERVLHRLLRAARIGGWEPNLPVTISGRVYELDIGFAEAKLAIEVDGYSYHSEDERFQGDRTRQNAVIGAGWRVLRFTWADLDERPTYVVTQIRKLLAD